MSYAGDLQPHQAWELLKADATAVLVDVRSEAEWNFVGVPDLSTLSKRPLFLSWLFYPGQARNPDFLEDLARLGPDPKCPILFLCRSGVRSAAAAAAATAAGYTRCFNIAEGFEGDRDAAGHRGTSNGWKVRNLPWIQG